MSTDAKEVRTLADLAGVDVDRRVAGAERSELIVNVSDGPIAVELDSGRQFSMPKGGRGYLVAHDDELPFFESA